MSDLRASILRASAERFPDSGSLAGQALDLLRDERNFFCTWVDLVRADGLEPPAWCGQIQDAFRRRQQRYEAVLEDLRVGGVPRRVLKGPAIATRYPPGLMRGYGDLDLAVGEGYWPAVALLEGRGFIPDVLTVGTGEDGDLSFLIHLVRAGAAGEYADHVDLASAPWTGNLWRSRDSWSPFERLPSPALQQLLVVAAEGWERPFGLRDMVDTAVLAADADSRALASVTEEADSLGVEGFLRGLLSATAAAGLFSGPPPPPGPRATPGRLARRVRCQFAPCAVWAPLRRLESSYVFGRRRRLVGRTLNLVLERMSARQAVERGLLAFGIRPDAAPASPGPARWRNAHELATPIGTFVLTAGFELT